MSQAKMKPPMLAASGVWFFGLASMIAVGCGDSGRRFDSGSGPRDGLAAEDAAYRDSRAQPDGPVSRAVCDPVKATCRALPPACTVGEVAQVVSECWGECLPIESCNDLPAQPDCDTTEVLCNALPPTCPPNYVPTASSGCYGPCVPGKTCACTILGPVSQCPGDDLVCHRSRGRCGPLE